MSDKLKEAIEKLKWLSEQIAPSPIKEAIDTVVAELEKTTYTAEDMVDFHRWMKEGIYKNKVGIRYNGDFVQFIEGIPVTLSNEQVIKLWEEQK